MTIVISIHIKDNLANCVWIRIIGESITIFIYIIGITEFGCWRVDGIVSIIAIGIVAYHTGYRITVRSAGIIHITKSIQIKVGIIECSTHCSRVSIVGKPVTVFIDVESRTYFNSSRIDQKVCIVAVCIVAYQKSRRNACSSSCIGYITITILIRIGVEKWFSGSSNIVIIGQSVTIFIHSIGITDFSCRWIY